MNHGEIARVVLRKAKQRRLDLEGIFRKHVENVAPDGVVNGLLGHAARQSWIAGHGYEVVGEDERGAVLESGNPGSPRMLVTFLGRTPMPPYGGFAADIHVETAPEEWKRLTGFTDWQPAQWIELRNWWELVDTDYFKGFLIDKEDEDEDDLFDDPATEEDLA